MLLGLQKNTKMPFDYDNAFRARKGVMYDKSIKEVFSDLKLRQLMGVNTSADEATHIVFEIVEE